MGQGVGREMPWKISAIGKMSCQYKRSVLSFKSVEYITCEAGEDILDEEA